MVLQAKHFWNKTMMRTITFLPSLITKVAELITVPFLEPLKILRPCEVKMIRLWWSKWLGYQADKKRGEWLAMNNNRNTQVKRRRQNIWKTERKQANKLNRSKNYNSWIKTSWEKPNKVKLSNVFLNTFLMHLLEGQTFLSVKIHNNLETFNLQDLLEFAGLAEQICACDLTHGFHVWYSDLHLP